MADNHQITEGAGSTFRSTDNGGVKIPHSAIATAAGIPLDMNAGAVSAATLRMMPANEALLDKHLIGQGSQLALNQNILLEVAGVGSLDCLQYRQISIQVIPAAGTITAGVITFEGSNNGVNFQSVALYDVNSLTASPVTNYTLAASVNRSFAGAILFKYFRARILTGVTGTTTGVQAFAMLRMSPFTPQTHAVVNPTAASFLVTATPSGTTTITGATRSAGFGGTATITRAANTTPYTAGDTYGAAFTLATIGNTAGYTLIKMLRLLFNINAVPVGMGDFTLRLYNATPPSAIADNSPWTLNSGDRASYLAKISLGTPVLEGGGTVVLQLDNINLQLKIASGTSLFGYLVTDGGFTPAANSETVSLLAMAVEP